MAQVETVSPSAGNVPPDTFVKDRLPYLIATAGEFTGLYFWLHFFDQGGVRGPVLAAIVLMAGFVTERISVMRWATYFRGKMALKYNVDIADKPQPAAVILGKLTLICLTEITIWVTFVLVHDAYGWVAAFAVLLLGEQLQHAWDFALIARRPIGEYIPSPNAMFITLVEGGAGLLWLLLVRNGQPQLGGAFLLLGLITEHVVQAQRIKKDLENDVREQAGLAAAAPAASAAAGA